MAPPKTTEIKQEAVKFDVGQGCVRDADGNPDPLATYRYDYVNARMALKGRSMPELYHKIVDHLKAKGFKESSAWPIAVESVALGCLRGKTNLKVDGKKGDLGAAARARYCAAYAAWKSNHKGTGYGKKWGKEPNADNDRD